MQMQDELDYANADRQDLVARLMSAQALGQFLVKGYNAFRNYGVDFMSLREWKDTRLLEEAAKRKAHQAQELIVRYFGLLNSALDAAIARTKVRVAVENPDPLAP